MEESLFNVDRFKYSSFKVGQFYKINQSLTKIEVCLLYSTSLPTNLKDTLTRWATDYFNS